MKFALGSLLAAGLTMLAGAWLMPGAQAQISSISSADQLPPVIRGTCFATTDNRERHLRVEEVRNGWIRVATAGDKNQTNSLIRVESRWLNPVHIRELTILSGPKACDFLE